MVNHNNLDFYHMALKLDRDISLIVKALNEKKEYDIARQLNKSSFSIASNISEGAGKYSIRDYVRFLRIAKGSSNELETQLLMIKDRGLISLDTYDRINKDLVLIKKKLSKYMKKIVEDQGF